MFWTLELDSSASLWDLQMKIIWYKEEEPGFLHQLIIWKRKEQLRMMTKFVEISVQKLDACLNPRQTRELEVFILDLGSQ